MYLFYLQLLQRRKVAMEVINWPDEKKRKWRGIMTLAFTSSDEEIQEDPAKPPVKKKKCLTWQSEEVVRGKDELDKCSYLNAGPRTKNNLSKYVGMRSDSLRPPPPDAPIWALK